MHIRIHSFLSLLPESSSQSKHWLPIHPEPTLYPDIHSYEDASGQIRPILPGCIEVGINYKFIRGIVINNQLRPVFDAQGNKVVVYVGRSMLVNIRLTEDQFSRIPFGIMPTYTAQAIIRERN